jgi:hypothetical protein
MENHRLIFTSARGTSVVKIVVETQRPGFRFPTDERSCSSIFVGFVVFGGIVGASMRRGRASADNSEVLAMFRLQYGGEGATNHLVDDPS